MSSKRQEPNTPHPKELILTVIALNARRSAGKPPRIGFIVGSLRRAPVVTIGCEPSKPCCT